MEAAETEHEDRKEHGDERANQTCPVLLHNFSEDFTAVQAGIIGVIFDLMVVDDHVCNAHRGEQDNRARKMSNEQVKETKAQIVSVRVTWPERMNLTRQRNQITYL